MTKFSMLMFLVWVFIKGRCAFADGVATGSTEGEATTEGSGSSVESTVHVEGSLTVVCDCTCPARPPGMVPEDEVKQRDETIIAQQRNLWLFSKNLQPVILTPLQQEWFDSLSPHQARRRRKKRDPPRTRKEYRRMTSQERSDFIAAVTSLKSFIPDPIPGDSGYDIFVKLHQGANAPAAHVGAAFLPWHREFLTRFENALVEQGYQHGLPFFDSRFDALLPDPSASAIWTEDYLGSPSGVVGAPFAGWTIVDNCQFLGDTLTRDVQEGAIGNDNCFDDAEINDVLDEEFFKDIIVPVNPSFEDDHGWVHIFIGDQSGHMGSILCSPSDPVFWMHHAFVDCVWEEFRQNSQMSDPLEEYPTSNDQDIGGADHEPSAPMLPFNGLTNKDGLSDIYTNDYYSCASILPVTCNIQSDCGSRLLWCNTVTNRCTAKLRKGSSCKGLSDEFEDVACGECPFGETPKCNFATKICTCIVPF